MEEIFVTPKYQKISLDIANAIYKGSIEEGSKLHGRSTLAGKYNVSPETIRRAIKLLEDVGVVKSSRGSGITVLSKDHAFGYIKKHQNIESVASYRAKLVSLISQKGKIENEINITIDKIVDYSGRFSNINPLTPLEIEVPGDSPIIGKTLAEVMFWQYTGATIVAIKRENAMILSPGPYATFEVGDVLLLIGEEKIYNSAKMFLAGE